MVNREALLAIARIHYRLGCVTQDDNGDEAPRRAPTQAGDGDESSSGVNPTSHERSTVRSGGEGPLDDTVAEPSGWGLQRADLALVGEETSRARGWAMCVMAVAGLSLVFLPWLPGALTIKLVFAGAALTYVATAAWVLWRIRDERRYTRQIFRIWGYISVVMSIPIQYTLGTFSPTPLIVTLGLSFFGHGLDRRHAILIPTVAIVLYFVMAVSILTGVLPDYGMYSSAGAPRKLVLFFTFMVPVVFVGALLSARVSHASLINAVDRAVAAQRLAGDREAQLLEAEQELEEVLHAGAGLGGRYTGAMAGPYELGVVVGRGAMGEIYAAQDVETGRRAAIKLVRADVAYDAAMYRRFIREGKIIEALDVPNVVQILSLDRMADGAPFIAMELLRGEDLSALLRRERTLGLPSAVRLVTHTARGIGAAHRAGIVHRDLKPQNLFFHTATDESEGLWKVLDFGVSKLADSSGTLTQGALIGTPAYMAPEQAGCEAVDHRCDIYALGAVLFRVLTGRVLFGGGATTRLLFQVVYFMPPRPSELNADLPKDIDRVFALALAKSPPERFASAEEMAEAVKNAAHGELPEALRQRADRLIERYPWGCRIDETVG